MTDYGYATPDPSGQRGSLPPDYGYSSGREHLAQMPAARSPGYDPYYGGTVSDPTYNFGLQPYMNNLPIGPDWLRQNIQQTDPAGTAFRAPGYDPTIPLAGLAQQWGQNYAKDLAQQQMEPIRLAAEGNKDIMRSEIDRLGVNYGREQGYAQTDYDIGNRRADLQQAAIDRQRPYLGTLHDLALQGMNAQARQQQFGLFNQAVGAGNVLTGGYRVQRGEIAGGLQRGTAEENARYQENLAQLDDKAKDLGLSREDLANQLARGLERLGVSNFMDVNDLLQKMNSTDIATATQANSTYNQIMAGSDIYARLYPGPADAYQPGPAAQNLSIAQQRK
jgi:hypothetical protein